MLQNFGDKTWVASVPLDVFLSSAPHLSLMDPSTPLSQFQADIFTQILSSRHSKRSFIKSPQHASLPICPPKHVIQKILRSCSLGTPSTKNTQPWGVSVLQGSVLSALSEHLLQKFDHESGSQFDKSEYLNRPENPTLGEFDERIATYGRELFAFKGVERVNDSHRKAHDRDNYTFFGAPLVLLLHVPDRAVAGTFVDAGLFLQSLLLSFHAYGYGACPQYSLTRFAKTIREFHLTHGNEMKPLIPDGRILVCGISVGVVDPDAKVNYFAPSRVALHEWVDFYGEDEQTEEK